MSAQRVSVIRFAEVANGSIMKLSAGMVLISLKKIAIDNRLSQLLAKVVSWRLEITDLDLLVSQLKTQQIKYHETRDPYCWLFELLRAGATQIEDPNQFGFAKLAMFEHKTLIEIRRDIDDEFYALSVAHYERYMVANRQRANRVSAQEVIDD